MEISRTDRLRIEQAHVLAWPALRTATVDGWLWRSSGGGSQRANSVSSIDFYGNDMAAAIAEVEARYHAAGMPARFHTFDETSPAGLADALAGLEYRETERTTTMFKPVGLGEVAAEVERRDHACSEWRDVYMSEITASRRVVNGLILDRVPPPRAFFGCRRDGRIISTALGVLAHGCAVVECVATRSDCRRQGGALAVLRALEAWASAEAADLLGLQMVSTNAAALGLYERLGFVRGATNRFWVKSSRNGDLRRGDIAD